MKSGLEGRNNMLAGAVVRLPQSKVSMKSGLEGRNNAADAGSSQAPPRASLNEVRPRRPEQLGRYTSKQADFYLSQ